MDFSSTMEWQRCNITQINRLASLEDPLAVRLREAYRALYDDQLNIYKQSEWMKICDDFCRRELMTDTRRILQDRFGHKIPSEYKNIKT